MLHAVGADSAPTDSVMSPPRSRLSKLLDHFLPSSVSPAVADLSYPFTEYNHNHNFHTLSPTYFLPRAAAIEPDVRLSPAEYTGC